MFGGLEAMVRELEVPLDRDALRQLFAVRDLLNVKLGLAVGDYDAAGLYEDDGAVTMHTWLVHETGADSVTALRTVRHARLLRANPCIAEAVLDGRLSSGQVEVISLNVPARHRGLFADHAPQLLDILAELDADQTVVAMREWRKIADDINPRPQPPARDDELRLARTLDERGDVRGSFTPDLMAIFETALRMALERDDERTLAERQADALATICRFFLDHQRARAGGRHRPHVNIVLTYDQLVDELEGTYVGGAADGMPVDPAELGVLLCDSVLHRLVVSPAGILDYGRSTRTVPVDLYNALVLRDRGCRWPGCDRPAHWCDAHHVWEWEHGGPTCLDNLVLFCRRHHRKLHRGWAAKLLPDGTVELTHPDGRVETTTAPGPVQKRRRRSTGQPEPVAA